MKKLLLSLALFTGVAANAQDITYPCVSLTLGKELGNGLIGYQATAVDDNCIFERFTASICATTENICRNHPDYTAPSVRLPFKTVPFCEVVQPSNPGSSYEICRRARINGYDSGNSGIERAVDFATNEKAMAEVAIANQIANEVNTYITSTYNFAYNAAVRLVSCPNSTNPDALRQRFAPLLSELKSCLKNVTNRASVQNCYTTFETIFSATLAASAELCNK